MYLWNVTVFYFSHYVLSVSAHAVIKNALETNYSAQSVNRYLISITVSFRPLRCRSNAVSV
jgi:hypothetical protein